MGLAVLLPWVAAQKHPASRCIRFSAGGSRGQVSE
jgi:hypothetical protein